MENMDILHMVAKEMADAHPEGITPERRTYIDVNYQELLDIGLELNPEPERIKGQRG